MIKTLEVDNLKCDGCALTIKNGLQDLEVVENVNVNIEESLVEVTFDDEKFNLRKLKKVLKKIGYPVRRIV